MQVSVPQKKRQSKTCKHTLKAIARVATTLCSKVGTAKSLILALVSLIKSLPQCMSSQSERGHLAPQPPPPQPPANSWPAPPPPAAPNATTVADQQGRDRLARLLHLAWAFARNSPSLAFGYVTFHEVYPISTKTAGVTSAGDPGADLINSSPGLDQKLKLWNRGWPLMGLVTANLKTCTLRTHKPGDKWVGSHVTAVGGGGTA